MPPALSLSVTPTRRRLEYVDWANPILAEPLRMEKGMALPGDKPGNGLEWNEDAIRGFEV